MKICFINKYRSNAVIKLVISFRSGKYNVHPNAHSFRAGCHEMIKSRCSLDNEGEGRLWRSNGVHMVHVDFFDRLQCINVELVDITVKILTRETFDAYLEVDYAASLPGCVIAVIR